VPRDIHGMYIGHSSNYRYPVRPSSSLLPAYPITDFYLP
jgi:hypothetical protein